jgi:hypothetical protein
MARVRFMPRTRPRGIGRVPRRLGWGALDRSDRARAARSGGGDSEVPTSAFVRWQKVEPRGALWFAIGGGVRRFRTAAERPSSVW